ncbi:hypothetical protein GCM10010400_67400 [Streptomyces aculeolatus]
MRPPGRIQAVIPTGDGRLVGFRGGTGPYGGFAAALSGSTPYGRPGGLCAPQDPLPGLCAMTVSTAAETRV